MILQDGKLYFRLVGRLFEVAYIADSEDDANAFLEYHSDCGVASDEKGNNLGKIIICKNKEAYDNTPAQKALNKRKDNN